MRFYAPTSLLSSGLVIKSGSEGAVEAVLLTLNEMKKQDGFWGRAGIPSAHQTSFPSLQLPPPLGIIFISGNSRIGTLRAQKSEAIVQERLLSFSPNGNAFMS